jgi:DNA-binding CsgD family transcriptional regulator
MVHQLLATTGGAVTAAALIPSVRFTSRETEIMQLIAAGKPNGEIAASLFISVRTVESHINNIRRKTGAVDRSDISDFIAH